VHLNHLLIVHCAERDQPVTDLQWAPDRTYFITSSKDKTAKILAADSLEVLKEYVTDTPLNSAAITPVKDYVILGGGQAAMDVTTTSARQGKFEARFYHKVSPPLQVCHGRLLIALSFADIPRRDRSC
jgi:WD40 repeat protein